ncbi:hypothetical protein, partial [Thiolapillus sp.]|uniref:hypothetical protein n=1 Tax=Thiolapillus sp. TaxID=2017437 RepID=UPI003AF696A0
MFSLWRKARRENSAASRLLGSTSLRFALHGWQRAQPGDIPVLIRLINIPQHLLDDELGTAVGVGGGNGKILGD